MGGNMEGKGRGCSETGRRGKVVERRAAVGGQTTLSDPQQMSFPVLYRSSIG
jgi:hypothetical protein